MVNQASGEAGGIVRFRRKPERQGNLSHAAQYEPGRLLDSLLSVAQMSDPSAQIAEAGFPLSPVLVVRHMAMYGNNPPRIEYTVIEPGSWLAYNEENDMLYPATDANWRKFYEIDAG